MDIVVPLLVIAILITLNGLFVAAEFAIVGVPRAAIERRALGGDQVAQAVRRILHDPRLQDRYIATAQLGITFSSLGLGMYGEHVLAHWIEGWFEALGAARWIAAHAIASVLAVTILTYFHIVLGEMVPKALALSHAERTALRVQLPMEWLKFALYPLVVGLNEIGNGVLRLMGINRQAANVEQFHTAEELQYVVRESQEGGLLREEAGEVLQELFEFGDLTAGEVLVPRVRIAGIPAGATPAQVAAVLKTAPHTRYPVFTGDLDHVEGTIHIKDALSLLLEGRPLREADLRVVPFVPATATLDLVLHRMSEVHTQMAVVLDEQGGTAGIVTVQDLFDEVVGPIDEEHDAAPEIAAQPNGELVVAGTVRLESVGEALGVTLEHEAVDTVSGLVLMLLGRPAAAGDVVVYQHTRIEVTAVEGHGVKECRVTLDPLPDGPPATS